MSDYDALEARLRTLFEPVPCDHRGAAAPWACENCMNIGLLHDQYGDAALEAADAIRTLRAEVIYEQKRNMNNVTCADAETDELRAENERLQRLVHEWTERAEKRYGCYICQRVGDKAAPWASEEGCADCEREYVAATLGEAREEREQ